MKPPAQPGVVGHRETLLFAVYYAPRGRARLYRVAAEISQRHLLPTDLLIGIIGSEGVGKSTLIKGLFPGLELTNDDHGVNLRSAPIYDFDPQDEFSGHTFHLDTRYELAFKQQFEIVAAIKAALEHGRRVVVEHFDLLYDAMGFNAQVLFAIGEEVIVARPTIFGPYPANIKNIVDQTAHYRFMAHSAEDITSHILEQDYNYHRPMIHSDIRHGFVISFPEKPDIDIAALEARVREVIAANVPIGAAGDGHIRIGDEEMSCTGIRTHVKSSGEIRNFRLLKDYRFDPYTREWLLVGKVGDNNAINFETLMATLDAET